MLLNLLKLAHPSKIDLKTKESLQDIAKGWDTCQKHQSPPVRFNVSLATE